MKWYLDFGHGGKDSGALGTNKTKESRNEQTMIATGTIPESVFILKVKYEIATPSAKKRTEKTKFSGFF